VVLIIKITFLDIITKWRQAAAAAAKPSTKKKTSDQAMGSMQ
jgi:hypothetical protein